MKDRQSLPALLALFERWRWAHAAEAMATLAEEDDMAIMLRALAACRSADDTRSLMPWFGKHPSSRTIPILRGLIAGRWLDGNSWSMALHLATKGDEVVVRWALDELVKGPPEKALKPLVILAYSPTQRANDRVADLIRTLDEERLLSLFYGLITGGNESPRRWELLESLVSRPLHDASVKRRMLEALDLHRNRKETREHRLLEVFRAANPDR